MQTRIETLVPSGVRAEPVEIVVDVSHGLSTFDVRGLPGGCHERELRERVRAAFSAAAWYLPRRAITVTIAPPRSHGGDLSHLDLPVALALLACLGRMPDQVLRDRIIFGALGLDAMVQSVPGALAIAQEAGSRGIRELLVPADNAAEAAASSVPVIAVRDLGEAVGHLLGETPIEPLPKSPFVPAAPSLDLAQVSGNEVAQRALEVAAAGGHHILLVGPPGSGKTKLARRLTSILPPLTEAEAIEVTKVHSLVAGVPFPGLVSARPFRSPHPGVSSAGMLGGGAMGRPGEVSLAHGGVLFLDELPEFRRDTLESLRYVLREGEAVVARHRRRLKFPARLTLVAAMTGCPCGHRGAARRACRCAPDLVRRYRARVLAALEAIDICVETRPLTTLERRHPSSSEPSSARAKRVSDARAIESRRFGASRPVALNAALAAEELDDHCRLAPDARRLWGVAVKRLKLPTSARTSLLRVARTIADLEASETLIAQHVEEAIQYRSLLYQD